jgi:capsular exopolysaccharide synthesis family protein
VTPREYIEIVRERWRSIVAGLVLGLVVGGGITYLVPPEYSTSVTVLVAEQTDNTDGTSDSGEISSQRLGTYVELLGSKRVASGVISDLRLSATSEELADRISVSTTPDSLLLSATVTDGSPDQVIRIANAVADQFIKNVAEIEQPSDPTRPPAVVAKMFEEAQPPAQQVAPRPVLYLAVGAVVGLLVGIAAALLGQALDFRVKTRRQLEEIFGVPVLGIIGRDSKIPSSPLVMYGAPHTPLAEAFRQLRTNVQFLDVDREHKVILVTSATAGEGRSTTVCNLGLALSEAGTRVLILDADLRDPSIARILSIDGVIGLSDVLVNRIPVERALQPVGPTLDVLPSVLMPPNPSELLGSIRMVELLARLRAKYDVILVDTAPLVSVTDAAVLAPRCDGVLVVVRHGLTVVQDVQAAKDALSAVSARILGSVMTMVPHGGTAAHARRRSRKGERRPRALGQVPTPRASTDRPPADKPPTGSQPADYPPHPARELHPPAPRPSPGPREPKQSAGNGQVLDRDESAAR